jgi:hypothetical protein
MKYHKPTAGSGVETARSFLFGGASRLRSLATSASSIGRKSWGGASLKAILWGCCLDDARAKSASDGARSSSKKLALERAERGRDAERGREEEVGV